MRARLFGLPDNPEETAQPSLEIGQTGETDHLTLTELPLGFDAAENPSAAAFSR